MRGLVVIVSAFGAILLFLLASAGTSPSLFAENYRLLMGLNGVIALALLVLVGVQLRGLWREYRQRQFGSRLKLKLLGVFLVLTLVPGSIIYLVSVQFAVRSIEPWYNDRVDGALKESLSLGRNAIDALLGQLAERSRSFALEMGDKEDVPSIGALSRIRDQLNADSVSVLSVTGRVLRSTGALTEGLMAETQTSGQQLRQARQALGSQMVEIDGKRLVMRVVVPLPLATRQLSADPLLMQVIALVPEELARSAEAIQELHNTYQELVLARQGLKRMTLVTLTLAFLLAMFAAMGFAFLLSRSLTAPLLILAEGTQAVAAGDFTPRQALPARDELGVLTHSFNRMTHQLQEARAQAERSRAAVDASRAYLESVLTNLSAGVLAFSEDGRLRAANRGALTSLRDELKGFEQIPLAEWPAHQAFRDAVLAGFEQHEGDWHQQLEIQHADGSLQTLLLHGARLPEQSAGGYVVVFDDISALISAQRNAAWAEVARRLAHEIKNPLTPIQLAAERLELKLADRLGDTDRAMLSRSIQTIVNQVEAMKTLVNSFRDYARLPPPTLAPVDLNALLREVLVLYESSSAEIHVELGQQLPPVLADSSQLRQVIHNLLQNAQDAVADQVPAHIAVSTRQDGRRVELTVRDSGPGFPPAMLARAFEPYVTSKARGSGLGLAIVKKIVEEHQGEILIANAPGSGAEVRLRLPWTPPRST